MLVSCCLGMCQINCKSATLTRRWEETADLYQLSFFFWRNWCYTVTLVLLQRDKVPVSATSIQNWKLWDMTCGNNPLATPQGPLNSVYGVGKCCPHGGIGLHNPKSPWPTCLYNTLHTSEVSVLSSATASIWIYSDRLGWHWNLR